LRSHENITCVEFDLEKIEKIPEMIRSVGDIDILINNAGVMNALPYDNYSEDKKENILKVNLEAPVALIKEISAGMITRGSGRIVSISSVAGEIGHPDIWYGITKAGVINFTKSFAKILGPKNIAINCVAPGPVEDTPMFDIIPDARKDQMKQAVVSGRFAKPEEVAKTVYWLAVEAPEYINGICIDINNGSFMR
jgi:NAD(P)-dependent dehydrogenase (short-subunit alcohol dehydrogenase family)